jgi:hypothetical protein
MRFIYIASAVLLSIVSPVYAANDAANGNVSVQTMMTPAAPAECGVNPDCKAGEICEMSMRINGKAATAILQTLKKRVAKDAQFSEMGLSIYQTKDSLLRCDATDPKNVFCDMDVDAPSAKLQAPPVCE